MNELIWFSIPGAVGLWALHLVFPHEDWNNKVVVIASAPVLGFILHQLYRVIFESTRGWEKDARPVLALIRETYKIADSQERMPFLIWETTFYSNDIPKAFREHNRNSWHYVMSFRSVAFTSAFSGLAVGFVRTFWRASSMPFLQLGLLALLFLLFWQKGRLTYLSLTRQECSAFRRYRKAFDDTRRALAT
jgi:hypothetical protein